MIGGVLASARCCRGGILAMGRWLFWFLVALGLMDEDEIADELAEWCDVDD